MYVLQPVRERVIEDSVAAAAGDVERRPVPWRNGQIMLPVVEVPVTHVLLNPRSHRIKAQVASAAASQELIRTDPFGEKAQNAIADIIRKTSGYEKIKNLLSREAQRDPGVITHTGVLINANTRLVALRELDKKYIKVQVLPRDASSLELDELELGFQMETDSRQAYTFTNKLLFIRDLLDENQSPLSIGLKLEPTLDPRKEADRKAAASSVEADARLLNLIETIIQDSSGALAYEFFDNEAQTLRDIDATYESMIRRGDLELAERVRRAKLTGVLAGLDYRKVRMIDDSLLTEYAVAALEEQEWLKDHAGVLAAGEIGVSGLGDDLTGLDVLEDLDKGGPSDDAITLMPIYYALASTPEDADVELPVNAEGVPLRMSKTAFRNSVRNALITAVDNKEQDNRYGDGLQNPIRRLANAARACDQVKESLARVPDRQQLDISKLTTALEDFERARDEMRMVLGRSGVSIDDESDS